MLKRWMLGVGCREFVCVGTCDGESGSKPD